MENDKNEEKMKSKKLLQEDSISYKKNRVMANARKRKFLNNMTPEQIEMKKLKDREYYLRKRAENKVKTVSDMTERQKKKLRELWRKSSQKYRQKKKMMKNILANSSPDSENEIEIENDNPESKKKSGRKQDQTKILIAKVYHYFEQEYEELKTIYGDLDLTPLSKFRQRTALATGVSETTVLQILKEEEERNAVEALEPPAKARRARKRPRKTKSSSEEDSSEDNDNDDNEQPSGSHEVETLEVKIEPSEYYNEEPEIYISPAAVKVEPDDNEGNKEQAQSDPISLEVKTEPQDDAMDDANETLALNEPAGTIQKGSQIRRSDATSSRIAYNYPMAYIPDEHRDLSNLLMPLRSNPPVDMQDAAASTSATRFAEPPTISAPKSSAQRQREYRQRLAESRTPEQLIATRISDTERKRNYRLRKAAKLALASGSLQSTTAPSSRSAGRSNDVQNITQQHLTNQQLQSLAAEYANMYKSYC